MSSVTDILIKNKTIWLSQGLILRSLPDLTDEYLRISRNRYKQSVSPSFHSRAILPDTGKAWRWAKMEDQFYYAYNNIPDKAPNRYKSQLPPQDQLKQQSASPETPTDLTTYFKEFLNTHYTAYLNSYADCTRQQQVNLSKAAAALEAAYLHITNNNINLSKSAFFLSLSEIASHLDIKYFGTNPRVIKKKVESVITGTPITQVIHLPRANNDNASKGYSDEEITSWVLTLREMGRNYTNAFIIRKINEMCSLTCKPCPSDRWIGEIMQRHNVKYLTAEQRYGKGSRFAARYRDYVPMQNALFAGDCWMVDGTRVNLEAHKGKDKNGKSIRQYLYIVAVRDVHSGDLLGWHYTINEDRWAVFNAIKMAVKETGYLPYEMFFDKFPGHNTPEMETFIADLEQWGCKVKFSSSLSGKPNLERWFGTLQTVFMQESAFYYGQGIKSRAGYAHRSEEYLTKLRQFAWKNDFDFDDASRETTKIIEAYRHTPYCNWSRKHAKIQLTPAQMHDNSAKPNVVTLDEQDYSYLFGLKEQLRIQGSLITKVISHIPYNYRITDYEVFSKHDRVLVSYDLDDLSSVSLFEISDNPIKRYLGRAFEETEAQRFGPDAQWGEISRREALIKEFEGYKEQELEYRKAAGSDITVLIAPMSVNKYQAEQAETHFLNNQLPPSSGDDIDISNFFLNQF